MKDALKQISEELAASITERFQSDEMKQLVAETKAAPAGDTGSFDVVITTENLDRYNEVIKLDGWELGNYLNNPVVLWAHDHTQPIGVATNLEIRDGKMMAQGKFAPNQKGQEIRQLYDAGIVRATSVGFIEKEREGNLITKAELLEFSFVSVPANPYALALAMERDFNVNELVTKGILFVEKDGEEAEETIPETVPESEGGEEAPEDEEQADIAEEERGFSTKQLSPVIDSLKAAVLALEALGATAEEPEGEDEPEANDQEAKALEEFTAQRKALQSVATALGDVLAEMRQVAEASR